jgi:fucose permease
MADWSAVYLHDTLASSAALAAAGFAACSMMMAVGRFGGDRVVGVFGAAATLRASGALAAAGLGLALLVGTPIAAIVGCGMVGLGIANAIPILFSRAGNLVGVDPGTGLAAVATIGYLGFLAGPPLIGVVAQLTTLRCALAVVVAACALIALYGGAADAVTPSSGHPETAPSTATPSSRRAWQGAPTVPVGAIYERTTRA